MLFRATKLRVLAETSYALRYYILYRLEEYDISEDGYHIYHRNYEIWIIKRNPHYQPRWVIKLSLVVVSLLSLCV